MDLAATSGHSCAGWKPQENRGDMAGVPKSSGHGLHPEAENNLPPAGAGAWDGKGEAGSAPQGRLTFMGLDYLQTL